MIRKVVDSFPVEPKGRSVFQRIYKISDTSKQDTLRHRSTHSLSTNISRRHESPLMSLNDDTRDKGQILHIIANELFQVLPLSCMLYSQLKLCLLHVLAAALGLDAEGNGCDLAIASMVDGLLRKVGAILIDNGSGVRMGFVVVGVDVSDVVDLFARRSFDLVLRKDGSGGAAYEY